MNSIYLSFLLISRTIFCKTDRYIYQGSVEGGLGTHLKELKKVVMRGKLRETRLIICNVV